MPMNRKTFTLAVIFLVVTILWLGILLYWMLTHRGSVHIFDLFVSVIFVLAGLGMVYNEAKKKKRRHLEEVKKYKIP